MQTKNEIEKTLLENAKHVSTFHEKEIMAWDGLVLSKDKLFIPGYIPYIGKDYFDSDIKIMNYALSQDIYPDWDFVVSYANNWKEKQNAIESLNRQNLSFEKNGMIQMRPFDTGHLPILSGILTFLISKDKNLNPIEKISATNLSKFSFRNWKNETTDNEKSLNKCFDWFSKHELESLKPDYVICAGDRVFNIIKRKIIDNNINTKPIKIIFPSIRVINRHYRKDMTNKNLETFKIIKEIFSENFLTNKTEYVNKKIIDILDRDKYYFVKMYELIKFQIEKYGV